MIMDGDVPIGLSKPLFRGTGNKISNHYICNVENKIIYYTYVNCNLLYILDYKVTVKY